MHRIVWLVCASACNMIYGLDETTVRGEDADGDGIVDMRDNCVDHANPSQADVDGDGLGDACDDCEACAPCDRGPNHDEDRDRLADGCDNCPAIANGDQRNTDGDELGDACDTSSQYERRLLFDGFGTLGPEWLQAGSRWTADGGDVGPAPMEAVTKTLQHDTVLITGGSRWAIEVGLVPQDPDRKIGVTAGSGTFCLLEHLATGDWQILAGASRGPAFAATFDTTIRFRMTPATLYASCDIPNVASKADSILELQYPVRPLFVTNYDGPTFRYIEIIGE